MCLADRGCVSGGARRVLLDPSVVPLAALRERHARVRLYKEDVTIACEDVPQIALLSTRTRRSTATCANSL